MTAWDYPGIIVAALAAAVFIGWLLMRAALGKQQPGEGFACAVCGRKQRGLYVRQWRYCPYCGAPRGSTSLRDLPRNLSRRR